MHVLVYAYESSYICVRLYIRVRVYARVYACSYVYMRVRMYASGSFLLRRLHKLGTRNIGSNREFKVYTFFLHNRNHLFYLAIQQNTDK